ncbi:MAG: YggS family pyridoxal phosphate-dependent enzyme [Vicinamibacterales bacterium]
MTPADVAERIRTNLEAVRVRIARAASNAHRSPTEITLVAVSKTFPASYVRAAAAAGHRDFGENKVQEALEKVDATADLDIRWHLIGHLQSNKARRSVGPFALIHAVDNAALLGRLDAVALEAGVTVDVLVQVDLAGEATKFGLEPAAVRPLFDAASANRGARIRGLMLLPPFADDPEASRPYFRQLRELQQRWLADGVSPDQLGELSMGMSHDFDVAIEEGATLVRVGTAIFGDRRPAGADERDTGALSA